MAQVSNQTQLLSALAAQDSIIQVTADFSIRSQINILYAVTIESLPASSTFTLTKDSSYSAFLFRVQSGGSLTLQNIILDGDKDNHPISDETNRSLIYVAGGTLDMREGSIVRNNHTYLEGGGIFLNRNESYPNTLALRGNARITGCSSRTNGGGIMLAVGNALDSFTIAETAQIDNNHAANGGGIYCRSYISETPATLTIADEVHITGNQAESAGGGIWFSGFRANGSAASALTLSGNALISANRAANGGGIYFFSSNPGDRLAMTESVSIAQNTASQNGGGCNLQSSGVPAELSVDRASITGNTAATGGGVYLLSDAGASATLRDVMLENNQATVHAGGMALYSGIGALTFRMNGGSVSHNRAAQEGGGFVISSGGPGILHFDRSVISQNTAHGSGGGLYYANTGAGISSTVTMTGVLISENTAGRTGGGLRLTSGTGTLTTLLCDCTISANTAQESSGGGIWNGGSDDKLTLSGTTVVTNNSTQAGNGGGIYFNSDNGTVLLTDNAEISANRADEVSTDFGNHGGGICLVPGVLTIEANAAVTSNRAGKYGGGISAAEESLLIMQGGTLQDNTSGHFGGGIWNHGGSTVILITGSISGNTAPLGNDIYSDANLRMEGARELYNGVNIATEVSIVKLVNALTADSAIQLELSPYVAPSLSGTPIVVAEATAAYPQLTGADADAFLKPQQGFEKWEILLSEDYTQVLLAPVSYQILYENVLGAYNPNPASYTAFTPSISLLQLPDVPGYHFTGWFDAATGGNQITSIPQGSSGNLTLYARWDTVAESYTVTFSGNDGCCPKACNIPDLITVQGAQRVTLLTVIPQRNGYCFRMWSTDCCGRGTPYLPGETIASLRTDLYLYAIWKRNRCGCPCPPPGTAS